MGRGLVPNGKIYYISLSINPFGQTGASSSASEVCKERGRETKGGWEPVRWSERDVKGREVAGAGAVGWNAKRWGENRKKPGRMREWFNSQQDVRTIKGVKGKGWVNDKVEKELWLVIRYERGKTMQELNQKKYEWKKEVATTGVSGNIKENYNTTSYFLLALFKKSYIFRWKTESCNNVYNVDDNLGSRSMDIEYFKTWAILKTKSY